MNTVQFIAFFVFIAAASCQRSPYAGRRPIGYPALETTTTTADPLGNRFGPEASTEPLPIEALGDRELVNRLAKLPIDKQPFWYINWKALETQRNNQQTYDQRPNPFLNDITNQAQPGQNQFQNQAQPTENQLQNQVQPQQNQIQNQVQPQQNQIPNQVQSNQQINQMQMSRNVRRSQRV